MIGGGSFDVRKIELRPDLMLEVDHAAKRMNMDSESFVDEALRSYIKELDKQAKREHIARQNVEAYRAAQVAR